MSIVPQPGLAIADGNANWWLCAGWHPIIALVHKLEEDVRYPLSTGTPNVQELRRTWRLSF